MKLVNDFRKMFSVQMQINFSCRNAFMSQHLLNSPNIGAIFQKVRGKGVSKGMWTNLFVNSGFNCQIFNN